jgi:hypothetical protein
MGSNKSISKLPNELSIEDLINSAESDPSPVQKINLEKNDVVLFLTFYDIKPGRNVIKKRFLYELYRKWSSNSVSKHMFGHEVGKFLPSYQIGKDSIYKLSINAFDINERLYALILKKTKNKTKSSNYMKHFEHFIKKYEIKHGTVWLESFVLYYLYDKWIYKINKNNPLGRRQFFNFCKMYFKFKRLTKSKIMWFGIHKNIYKQLTRGEIREIRQGYYEKNKRERKEKRI